MNLLALRLIGLILNELVGCDYVSEAVITTWQKASTDEPAFLVSWTTTFVTTASSLLGF